MRRLAQGDHTVAIAQSPNAKTNRYLIDSVNGYRESLVRGHKLAELAEVERERLQAAVSNMPIGLSMFDAQRRLIICNQRYSDMYQLPPELTAPGTPLDRILKERVRAGVFIGTNSDKFIEDTVALTEQTEPAMQFAELRDGRSVSIIYQPMSAGGWVTPTRRDEEAVPKHELSQSALLTDLPMELLKDRMEAAARNEADDSIAAVRCTGFGPFKP